MMTDPLDYPLLSNEEARLEALYRQDILDSDAEVAFDRLTELAKVLFNVPIALISFVDRNRQWFKSCIGLDVKETPREVSFCTHAIISNDVMVVNDAEASPAFCSNPLVTGAPHIRFYAGATLLSSDGYPLGTLCIIDTEARTQFDSDDQAQLRRLAETVSELLHLRRRAVSVADRGDAKSEFLSTISHEIRSPLNAIVGVSGLLKQNIDQYDQSTVEMIKTLSTSAESLMDLVNAVLDLSSIEARQIVLDKTPFSLGKLLQEVERISSSKAREKNLTFTVDAHAVENLFYEGDELRLRQVMINLITNAIKFTEQGAITVKASYPVVRENSSDTFVELQVIDTGIGIPKERLSHIFQKFGQVNQGDQYRGTGLGLPISNELVHLMGGKVEVESAPGFGSKFFVLLPSEKILASETSESSETKRQPVFGKGKRILVAEDYEPNELVLGLILEHYGYESVFVGDGYGVLAALDSEKYDAVLMDINMPKLDGVEATKLIRSSEALFANIPIIGMSGHAFGREKDAAIAAGMTGYLTKPVTSDLLIQTLGEVLNSKSSNFCED